MTLEHQLIPPCDFACESHQLLIEGDGDEDAMHDESLLELDILMDFPLLFIKLGHDISCGTKGTCLSFSSMAMW